MYWIFFSLIALITLFFVIGFFIMIKEDGETAGNLFIGSAICGLVMWIFIENKTYKVGSPKDIKPKEISIMKDKEVAILRYKNFQETYNIKKEYDAISDSTFTLQETTEYNIQGEENGKTYKLVTK
jgi:hypothetical protein